MNILYLAHRIPFPPIKGDKLRAFHQIKRLARRHKVWCVCFLDDARDEQHVDGLREICEDVIAVRLNPKFALMKGIASMARGRTLTESYFENRKMRRVVEQLSNDIPFDVVVAFSSGMAPYALRCPTKKRVLDLCDLDSQKWVEYASFSPFPVSLAYRMEGRRLFRKELAWIREFDASLLITDSEREVLSEACVADKISVVGNGVELPSVESLEAVNPIADFQKRKNPPTVGFIGVMDYKPNVDAVRWFAECSWPAIRSVFPEAEFRIVGRSATRSVRRLERIPGVCVVGEVENVAPELQRFDVSVAPLRIARGLQNKVLEAMAAGLPSVMTPEAATGIGGRHGVECLIADTGDGLAGEIVGLLRDRGKRHEMGIAARLHVATYFNWGFHLDEFERIVAGATAVRSQPARSVVPPQTNASDSARLRANT